MRSSKPKSLSSLLSTAMKAPPKSKPKTLEAIAEQHHASSSCSSSSTRALDLFVSATTSTAAKKKTKANKSQKEKVESLELDSLFDFIFSGVKPQACSEFEAAHSTPPPSPPPRSSQSRRPEDKDRWWKQGMKAIADGKLAVVLLYGGKGTCIGSSDFKHKLRPAFSDLLRSLCLS